MEKNIMIIRRATNKDTIPIIELVIQSLEEFDFLFLPETSEADLIDIKRSYFDKGGVFVVLENDNNHIVATGGLLKLNAETYKIRKMYVEKKHRGKGYGKLILNKLIEAAKQKGGAQIVLETSEKMKSAIDLYKSFDFKEIESSITSPRCDKVFQKLI